MLLIQVWGDARLQLTYWDIAKMGRASPAIALVCLLT